MAPDTVALGDQIQTETRRPRTGARLVPPLLMLDEHDPPFNNGGCFKHRPDKQSSSTVPRPRAAAPVRPCGRRAGRFLFRYRDAPAGMTSSSGRPGLILRARTVARRGSPERRRVLGGVCTEPPTEKQETELARTYKNPWPRPTASSVSVCLEVEMI